MSASWSGSADGGHFTYNHGHHHIGIELHTAVDVNYGHDGTVSKQRSAALDADRTTHPERFSAIEDPKILDLPADAWINPPPAAEPVAA